MKKRIWISILMGCYGMLQTTASQAVSLTITPAVQTAIVGQMLTVDIVVSALGSDVVGAFDLDVLFNPSRLAFTGATFGPHLGNPFAVPFPEALVDVDDALALTGVVNFAEVSLITHFGTLDALQPASFLLATLTFDAINVGTSSLSFTSLLGPLEVKDFNGVPLPLQLGDGLVQVVPEPTSLLLLSTGLAGLLGSCWRRRHTQRAAGMTRSRAL